MRTGHYLVEGFLVFFCKSWIRHQPNMFTLSIFSPLLDKKHKRRKETFSEQSLKFFMVTISPRLQKLVSKRSPRHENLNLINNRSIFTPQKWQILSFVQPFFSITLEKNKLSYPAVVFDYNIYGSSNLKKFACKD